jgi:hypothetical protein
MAVSEQDPSHGFLDQDSEEMTGFGITRVPVDYFHYKDFRYTQLADAVAEAKRDENRGRVL